MKVFTNIDQNGKLQTGVASIATANSEAYYNEGNLVAATQSAEGLMSAADKTKLDGIATGANKYILPTATSTILGGVKVDTALSTTSTNPVQNNVVNSALNEKADSIHFHTIAQITDFPSSMPASDVYAWAKAATKPSYTASEVGALSLSGGTLTSSEREVLAINSTAALGPILRLDLNGTNVASIGCIPKSYSNGYGTFINNNDGDIGIVIGVDGKLYRHASVYNLYPRYEILDASNYNSYSPTLTGTGASGTWGIDISGNADTVDGYHADYLRRGSWLGSVISDVAEVASWYTLKTITIKTKIPFRSGEYMPSIYIKGYAYGKALPVDLHLAFHVYSSAYFSYCASTSGGWAPDVYLSTYTEDSTKYVAVTLIDNNGVYSPRLYVDYVDVWLQSARYYSGWVCEGSSDVVIPTSDAVKIAYTPIPYATYLGTSAANYTYSSLTSALGGKSDVGHTHAFSELTSKPTTLAGYGITDALPLTGGTLTGALTVQSAITATGTIYSSTGIYTAGYVSARGQDTSSDISLKKDLKPIENALDYVLGTRYWKFKWKDNDEDCVGIVAQEEREREYGFLVRKHSDKYTYDYAASTALLGAALQEEDNKVERLRLRIEQLENEIKNLRYGN